MNRLQKKCLIATAGFHLLLLTILLVGPAFFAPKPKPDDTKVLDMIPANIVDTALNSGIRGAQPPPPAPAPVVTPPPQPVPPAPKPVVITPPAPVPAPKPAPAETKPPTPKLDLHPVIHSVPNNPTPPKPKDDSQQKLREAALIAARALQNKLSQPVEVGMSGDSDAAIANYASVVKSIYEQAWVPPDEAANDDANTKVSVTISSDGTVINAHIVTTSGAPDVDATVQRTLERVKFIAPFPPGSNDKERTYNINFNLKAKRELGFSSSISI